jgi:lysozyme
VFILGGAVLLGTIGLVVGTALYQRGYLHLLDPDIRTYPVRGIDVSSHQGVIDWNRLVAASSIDFAYIKASEGSRLRDPRFRANWEGSRGLLARGAYHFFTFCSPGAVQARNFIESVPTKGELPLAVDVEFAGNCRSWTSLTDVRRELAVFLEAVESAAGRAPVLYVTGESFGRVVRGHFDTHPLWVRGIFSRPSLREYPSMMFWQYAGNGRKVGISTLVDLNVFFGSKSDFEALRMGSSR